MSIIGIQQIFSVILIYRRLRILKNTDYQKFVNFILFSLFRSIPCKPADTFAWTHFQEEWRPALTEIDLNWHGWLCILPGIIFSESKKQDRSLWYQIDEPLYHVSPYESDDIWVVFSVFAMIQAVFSCFACSGFYPIFIKIISMNQNRINVSIFSFSFLFYLLFFNVVVSIFILIGFVFILMIEFFFM